MAQAVQLLRAKCVYCGHLKMAPAEVNRFICKLRLLEYGLIEEAEELDTIQLRGKKSKLGGGGDADVVMRSDSDSEEDDVDKLMEKRDSFVKRKIRQQKTNLISEKEKIEFVSDVRRAVLKDFMASSLRPKTCGTCKGISAGWRKDKFNKIFRKPLNKTDKAKMIQAGKKEANPLLKAMKDKISMEQRRENRNIDEAIGLDSDESISEEEGEDITMMDLGTERSNGSSSKLRSKPENSAEQEADQYVNPQEVRAALMELFEKEKQIMALIYGSRSGRKVSDVSVDMFFMRHVLVPPNKYRPEARTGDGEIAEAPENSQYKDILNTCERLNQIRNEMMGVTKSAYRERDLRDLQVAWVALQDSVNSLVDSDRNPATGAAAKRKIDGIKQRLEKKEGLFRMNMMGKRVNFAARSVISPDPNLETNEVGVPPVFARKLTYPEPVTNHNFYELKEAVLNGIEKWPGAAAIENESGQVINLRNKNFEERQALANQLLAPSSTTVSGARNKKVHRHLANGDIVIMNRQPTLHKPSMMAHRARVLTGEKTIRMHYANCNSYNADFDGDEMNMHFPQNEVARSEALSIADTDHQYLVATSGKPLRGLIQDHISMGVWLCNRDTFFDRSDYYQLLCSCVIPEKNQTVTDRIETVPPAIVKPQPLWTGKQIITTILKNITPPSHPGLILEGKSQTGGDRWGEKSEEGRVIFRDGEFLTGILDKAHLGPTGKGFVHSVYEAYGHTIAGRLLSILGRLLTKLLHMRAFSCGMADLRLTPKGDEIRWQKLKEADYVGREVASKYVTLDDKAPNAELDERLEDVLRDDTKQAGLDSVYSTRTAKLSSEIFAAVLPGHLEKPFPYNQFQTMTTSGAKGSSVNANQISCNLGQQALEGRRVPVMASGKTLPSFRAFETKVRAGGYITDRFLTGVKPQEYYFHAMAGREGLIDTAVKTSRSGYLQRCLIKGMEGLKSEYDSSIRDSDGSMVQFVYGEDGIDVTKSKHLVDFQFLAENYLSFVSELNISEDFNTLDKNEEVKKHSKKALKKYNKSGQLDCMDPVLTWYNPGATFGATSETFLQAFQEYCEKNPQRLIKDKSRGIDTLLGKGTFQALVDLKYMKSVIEPGEAVGVVAGQSIGEPSTQMTLNTFHLAGHAAKNVTLGIPRLREIVMTASRSISTPTMTLHPIEELSKEEGERFAKNLSKLTMAQIIDKVEVIEETGPGVGYHRAKIYNVRLELYTAKEYCETYAITVADVFYAMELQLVPMLAKQIKKELKRKGDGKTSKETPSQPEIGKSVGKTNTQPAEESTEDLEGDDDDMDDDGDDDAKKSNQRRIQGEATTYDEPDDEEELIAKAARRATSPDEPEDEGIGASPKPGDLDSESDSDEGKEQSRTSAKAREARIMENAPAVSSFKFNPHKSNVCEITFEYDISTPKLLLLPLVEQACHGAVIQATPGLGDCTLTKEDIMVDDPENPGQKKKKEVPVIMTQGVNLQKMHDHQGFISPHKIFTNDIAAMMAVYGVEAGRATIVREMDAVFKGHSINVDMRHLNLIGDVMTRRGNFTPFSRTGLRSAVSPFMKMSFETTMGFVRDAVLEGDWDDLKNPSARIVVGKMGSIGTGAFDVLLPCPSSPL